MHLSVGNVRLENTTNPGYVQVQIKSSKTDPFRRGVFMSRRLKSLSCGCSASWHPGLSFNSRYLTRDWFVSNVRSALQRAGIDHSHYSGHIASRWLPYTVDCQTRLSRPSAGGRAWRPGLYTVYIRTPRETLCSVARSLISGSC